MNKVNPSESIDLSIPRRDYYSNKHKLTICPECGSLLIAKSCSIILCVEYETNKDKFITDFTDSHFCRKCPVVVFDTEKLEQSAIYGIRKDIDFQYLVAGFVDLDSIPKEKRYLELGTDENPIPLVEFLPDLETNSITIEKNQGRNEPCSCGSGKKYKNCCGK